MFNVISGQVQLGFSNLIDPTEFEWESETRSYVISTDHLLRMLSRISFFDYNHNPLGVVDLKPGNDVVSAKAMFKIAKALPIYTDYRLIRSSRDSNAYHLEFNSDPAVLISKFLSNES